MQAIQTEYKGYLFRSRLEARWAVFFDACGVKWEYEPEGYVLSNGQTYLPDFLLHNVYILHAHREGPIDLYVEVKGKMGDEDARKIKLFASDGFPEWNPETPPMASKTATLVVGTLPEGYCIDEMTENACERSYDNFSSGDEWISEFSFELIDADCFAAFPGVDGDGKFTLFGQDSSYFCYMDGKVTEQAYLMRKQARFDHGATPRGVRPVRWFVWE